MSAPSRMDDSNEEAAALSRRERRGSHATDGFFRQDGFVSTVSGTPYFPDQGSPNDMRPKVVDRKAVKAKRKLAAKARRRRK